METGTGPNPKNCPSGWLPFRTFCYKINTVAKSYESARSACQQTPNTDLVSITDDYEFNFVRSLIYRNIDKPPTNNENVIEPGAWLGLTVSKSGGDMRYQWVDQFPFAKSYWDENEPNQDLIPNSPSKACVAMNLPYGNWGIVS